VGKTGLSHFGQTAGALSGTGDDQIDWSKTGWNVDDTGTQTGSQYFRPAANTYGFQIGNQGGYLDPTTGQITYGTQYKDNPGGYGTITTAESGAIGGDLKQYKFDIGSDYGLGSTALGIIPMQHDASGQVSQYVTQMAGGGFGTFTDLASAQAARDAYLAWQPTTKAGAAGGSGDSGGDTTDAAATPTYNDLSLPGASETNWDQTKDLYTQTTNAQQLQDSLAPSGTTNAQQLQNSLDPTGTTNAQTVFNETPNQPSAQEQQWNAYSGIYGDPHYLDDYYQRQEQQAQTTLDRKAASGGWGDSGAAAKATGNLSAVFADKALQGMEQFSTTGMGLATASDTGKTQRTNLYGSLATAADSANNTQLSTRAGIATAADSANNTQLSTRAGIATGADAANLAQLTGGQSAAHSAETDQQNRINGGLDRLTTIGNDEAALAEAGFSSADAELLSTELAGMQGEWTAAGLTAQQQYQKAQDLMQSMGLVSNSAVNYYLGTKFGTTSGTGSSYTTQTINY
jgi:hypothetical protein